MVLTQEQIALFPSYLNLWKNVGLTTEQVDTQSAVMALQAAYQVAGRPVPKLYLFFESPLQGVIASYLCGTAWEKVRAAALAKLRESFGAKLPHSLQWLTPMTKEIRNWYSTFDVEVKAPYSKFDFYRRVGRILVEQIVEVLKARASSFGGDVETFLSVLPTVCGNQINDILKDRPRERFWDDIAAETNESWPQVNDQLWASVPDDAFGQIHTCITRVDVGVWSPIQNEIWETLSGFEEEGKKTNSSVPSFNDIWEHIHRCGYGSLDADYLCFYAFFSKELGLGCGKPLLGLREIIQHCGWWWPFDNVVIYTNRPQELHFDDQNRSHQKDGPSISYRDDFACYSWKGRRVNRDVIMDDVTVEKIDKETNAEVRRILVERYGAANYVRDSKLEPIHSDDWGALFRKEQQDDDPIFVVKVICPTTSREYYLGIDPSAYNGEAGRNARAAVASTWRKTDNSLAFATPEEYNPEVQT